jgi:hypothetical protein
MENLPDWWDEQHGRRRMRNNRGVVRSMNRYFTGRDK